MLILSRVCAEFRNPRGETVFRITPANRLTFLEAPETIRSDPLFRMLIAEGSLEAVESVERRKQLEQNPTLGTDASGKKLTPEAPEETAVPDTGAVTPESAPEAAAGSDPGPDTGSVPSARKSPRAKKAAE